MFKEKNYKAKFLTISILKKKFNKDNFRKKTCGKTLNQSKNYVAKHCSNLNCLKKKTTKLNS
jgi:hypothetical protein